MKKTVLLVFSFFILCGFESLSDQIHNFTVENKTPASWEVKQENSVIKAYNNTNGLELNFYVENFMPNSPQCVSNKRIKDIKFDLDIYKQVQKGDSNWVKMIERMRINFVIPGSSEEKRVYGSNLIKNNAVFKEKSVVHIGILQFLNPFPCDKVDNMQMKITGITVRGRPLPPLELLFKLEK